MKSIPEQLIEYGQRVVHAGLVAGAGGNISARQDDAIWIKPSGLALDDMQADDLCRIRIADGIQTDGPHKPTSEVRMHLECYRRRPDIRALFHTHSPWASGIISAGATLRPMFAEFVCDLGRTATLPYVTPTTDRLALAVADQIETCDTLFLCNHGILATGATPKQAFYRCVVVEDAAKSMLAAILAGTPRYLTDAEIQELQSLEAAHHRVAMMSGTAIGKAP